MHPETREIAKHMREFGLTVLGRAAYDVTFSEMSRPFAHALAIGHAAHGAEIAIKSRIAQEHPLLIFTSLPRSSSSEDQLTPVGLFEFGRTIQFQDLPETLWATTGIRMAMAGQFQRFGRLRNSTIHFSVQNRDLTCETFRFLFEVMEPLVQEFWGKSIMDYASEWDEVTVSDGYLEKQLNRCKVEITPGMRAVINRIQGK